MAFIAGAFTATYDGSTIGQTEAGFNYEWTVNKRLITGDNQAATPQDAVFRGHEMFVSFSLLEFNAAKAQAAFWPYSATFGAQGTVGTLDVAGSYVKSLVLTPVSGTPLNTLGLAYTFSRAILAEGFPVNILFQPDLITVPLRMRIYPDASANFFTTA